MEGDEAEIAAALFDLKNTANASETVEELTKPSKTPLSDVNSHSNEIDTNFSEDGKTQRKRPRRAVKSLYSIDAEDEGGEGAFLVSDDEWDAEDEYLARRSGFNIKRKKIAKKNDRKDVAPSKQTSANLENLNKKEASAEQTSVPRESREGVSAHKPVSHIEIAYFIRTHRNKIKPQIVGYPSMAKRDIPNSETWHEQKMHHLESIQDKGAISMSIYDTLRALQARQQQYKASLDAYRNSSNSFSAARNGDARSFDMLRTILAQQMQNQQRQSQLHSQYEHPEMRNGNPLASMLLNYVKRNQDGRLNMATPQITTSATAKSDVATAIRALLMKSQCEGMDPKAENSNMHSHLQQNNSRNGDVNDTNLNSLVQKLVTKHLHPGLDRNRNGASTSNENLQNLLIQLAMQKQHKAKQENGHVQLQNMLDSQAQMERIPLLSDREPASKDSQERSSIKTHDYSKSHLNDSKVEKLVGVSNNMESVEEGAKSSMTEIPRKLKDENNVYMNSGAENTAANINMMNLLSIIRGQKGNQRDENSNSCISTIDTLLQKFGSNFPHVLQPSQVSKDETLVEKKKESTSVS